MQAPPVGTKGTVKGVDDTGSLLMRWDNGSGLNVVYWVDIVRKVGDRRGKYHAEGLLLWEHQSE